MLADVAGSPVCFDLNDGSGIHPGLLTGTEFYFKRSCEPARYQGLDHRARIFPLGLNYAVYEDGPDRFALQRMLQGTGGLRSVVRRLGFPRPSAPRLRDLEAEPMRGGTPRVLFYTRLWDPAETHDDAGQAWRDHINRQRMASVRALKRELSHRFLGGVEPGPLARRLCPDLLADGAVVRKRAYLDVVRKTAICVTTTGLHGSNGWKLAEYVAFARAIVTEPLRHEVPGPFDAGRNYLAFESPDQCVERCLELMDDAAQREAMMQRNHAYYHAHLQPEALVMNALTRVAGRAAPGFES